MFVLQSVKDEIAQVAHHCLGCHGNDIWLVGCHGFTLLCHTSLHSTPPREAAIKLLRLSP